MISINSNEDIRDQVLKLSLAGVSDTKRASEVLKVPKSTIWQTAKAVNANRDWYILTQTFGGDGFNLKVDKEDVQYFLDAGGYSKEEYLKKITDEDRMEVLQEIYLNEEVDIPQNEWDYKYNRKKAILLNAKAMDLVDDAGSNKSVMNFKLKPKGVLAINNSTTISNNQIQIDMSTKNEFNGSTQYVKGHVKGDVNQDNSKKND